VLSIHYFFIEIKEKGGKKRRKLAFGVFMSQA